VLVAKCEIANTIWSRFKGLIGRAGLSDDEAMWLLPCNSIHMFLMRFPIDVVFLNQIGKVVSIKENVPPFHPGLFCFKAHSVLELKAGCVAKKLIRCGDVLLSQTISA
jgi:uncharacterized membrane protein (UPF0127 family)